MTHCVRIRKAGVSFCWGENLDVQGFGIDNASADILTGHDEMASDELETEGYTDLRHKGKIRALVLARDYAFSICSTKMPNTKTAERKLLICLLCKSYVHKDKFTSHFMTCQQNREECDVCHQTFLHRAYTS